MDRVCRAERILRRPGTYRSPAKGGVALVGQGRILRLGPGSGRGVLRTLARGVRTVHPDPRALRSIPIVGSGRTRGRTAVPAPEPVKPLIEPGLGPPLEVLRSAVRGVGRIGWPAVTVVTGRDETVARGVKKSPGQSPVGGVLLRLLGPGEPRRVGMPAGAPEGRFRPLVVSAVAIVEMAALETVALGMVVLGMVVLAVTVPAVQFGRAAPRPIDPEVAAPGVVVLARLATVVTGGAATLVRETILAPAGTIRMLTPGPSGTARRVDRSPTGVQRSRRCPRTQIHDCWTPASEPSCVR